jgi:methionyl-tRNA synthetase
VAPPVFTLTTPIYYVNGRPHIGHAYTTIAADAAVRWQRQQGRQAWLQSGVDEHGQKVLEKAVARGMTPQAHCDDMVVHWQAMMDKLGVELDVFVRTTHPRHVSAVQACLQKLHDAGELFQDSYVGWYSPAAERFWTEKDLIDGKCPDTGQAVEKVEETNWFFRMSAYQQRLIDHIEANPGFVQPAARRNEVLGFLRKPLGDLCISRPTARMSWGIPFPFDDRYVTYVWFDALLNYVTFLGYHPDQPDPAFAERWPAAFQLLGKDILTTHAVYWTTMLMALGLPLPETLFAHGWWVSADGQKMSKSLGNVIDVDLLADAYGVDALRFFLLREVAFGNDGQFSYDGFLTRYNADLANDLGNLAHRALTMTSTWCGGVVPAAGAAGPLEEGLHATAAAAVEAFREAFDQLRFHDALDALFTVVRAGNKYLDEAAPWSTNKAGDAARTGQILRHAAEVAALASVLLHPVMPAKAAELRAKLALTEPPDALWARLAAGGALALLHEGATVAPGDPLFPRFREQPDAIAALLAEAAAAAPEPAPKPAKKGKKAAEPPAEIAYADFAKLALRVGQVVAAAPHPDADKLLVLQVDVGEAAPRQIVAGIATRFAPEALVGRKVVVVVNLAPADLRGVESQGMILAAGAKAVVDLVGVDAPVGEVVR